MLIKTASQFHRSTLTAVAFHYSYKGLSVKRKITEIFPEEYVPTVKSHASQKNKVVVVSNDQNWVLLRHSEATK